MSSTGDERDAALAEVTRLREALAKYGRHHYSCYWLGWLLDAKGMRDAYPEQPPCDCGFAAAIAEGSDVLPTGGAAGVDNRPQCGHEVWHNGVTWFHIAPSDDEVCGFLRGPGPIDVLPTRGAEPNE